MTALDTTGGSVRRRRRGANCGIPLRPQPPSGSLGSIPQPPRTDVRVLRWPEEVGSLDELTLAGLPCLLLVGAGPHPSIRSPLQDWVRVPVDPAELEARRATLARRAASSARPIDGVDRDGILRYGKGWTALSSTDRALFSALAAHPARVVATDTLCDVARARSTATLRVQITRLRARLAPLGLEIRVVRSRGYVLQALPEHPAAHLSALSNLDRVVDGSSHVAIEDVPSGGVS